MDRRHFLWVLSSSASLAACAGGTDGKRTFDEMGLPIDGDDAGPAGGGLEPPLGDGGAGEADAGAEPELPPVPPQPAFDFLHGVASGDPLHDRVVLWTRVTPDAPDEVSELLVDFVVAADPGLTRVVGRGRATASAARDFTIKVDVDGLSAGTTYYYRFHDPANEALVSDVGRTRTFAAGSVDRARFAVVSCSCFALGYFNAYADIASRKDLDAVLHLGDYIYEYGPETYDNPDLGRAHVPATEIVTLSDYRMRHAQYKSDPDLQEAHRQHPFICIWDDHEIANDAYAEGAQNHTDGSEGNFSERRAAALQAYGEWLPLREPYTEEPYGIYRRFRVGDLLDLIMLETRTRRSKQDRNAVRSDERSLLGETQAAWLEAELKASQSRGATWRVLGQQVMMGQLELFGQVLNADQWDGYQASRARLLGHIRDEGIDNVVVLTGDIHSSWAMDVVPDDATYDRRTGAGAVAVEFVSTSVTSPALEFLGGVAGAVALNSNPHMKWVDLERRGYLLLDVDHTRVQGDFYHSNTISMPIAAHRHAKSYRCDAGRAFLVEEPTPTSEKPGAPELA